MISLFKKKVLVVTHSGSFHADDIFAMATLMIYFKQEGIAWKLVRTRDENIIKQADYVFDVGGIYDPSIRRFDHHQPGGAGKRENGIPYASFGLVWKEYGPKITGGDEEVVQDIDKRLVQAIDAVDNGVTITKESDYGIYDYGIHGIVAAYQNSWKDPLNDKRRYENFLKLARFFSETLENDIARTKDRLELLKLIEEAYQKSEHKEIIEVPYHIGVSEMVQALHKYPEVLYVIAKSNDKWKVMAMRKVPYSFENRKSFPKEWAGKRGKELQKVTGVSDAVFCHDERWLVVTETRKGAWKIAELALID